MGESIDINRIDINRIKLSLALELSEFVANIKEYIVTRRNEVDYEDLSNKYELMLDVDCLVNELNSKYNKANIKDYLYGNLDDLIGILKSSKGLSEYWISKYNDDYLKKHKVNVKKCNGLIEELEKMLFDF